MSCGQGWWGSAVVEVELHSNLQLDTRMCRSVLDLGDGGKVHLLLVKCHDFTLLVSVYCKPTTSKLTMKALNRSNQASSTTSEV